MPLRCPACWTTAPAGNRLKWRKVEGLHPIPRSGTNRLATVPCARVRFVFQKNGPRGRIRTCGLSVINGALWLLSYAGKSGGSGLVSHRPPGFFKPVLIYLSYGAAEKSGACGGNSTRVILFTMEVHEFSATPT